MNSKPKVTVFGRASCHLCDKVIEVLSPLSETLNFDLEIILIDGNSDLEKEFGQLIPVTKINGDYVDHFSLDLERFKSSLEKHRQHQ